MIPADFEAEIEKIVSDLPPRSEFRWHMEGAELHLDVLRLAKTRTGAGTRFLARILDAADRYKLVTNLTVDPTDEPGDPDTFTLVRWYGRFGFNLFDVTDDQLVIMRRLHKVVYDRRYTVLKHYHMIKRERDFTRADFDRWLDANTL